MKIKKILASIIAGTLAVSSMALAAGAESVTVVSGKAASYTYTASSDKVTGSSTTTGGTSASGTIDVLSTASGTIIGGVTYTPADGRTTTLNTIEVVLDGTSAEAQIPAGKALSDVKFGFANGSTIVTNVTATAPIELKLAKTTYNTATSIDTTSISLKNSQKRTLGAAGKATLTLEVVNGQDKVTYKLDGTENKDVAVKDGKIVIDLTYSAEDEEFNIAKIDVSGFASNLKSAVLSWDDSATATTTTPAGSGDDISKDDGTGGDGELPEDNSNPGTGVMVAVIPAIVSAAAAVVSKKKR